MKTYHVKDSSITTLKTRCKWRQFAVAQLAGLLGITCGQLFGWPAPSIPKLTSGDLGFSVSKHEAAMMTIISPFGYIIGCPLSAILLDRVGRKITLLIISFPQIAAWILIATSTGIEMIYASRFLSGIAESALFASLTVYLAEIASPKLRAKLVATFTVDMMLGTFLVNCIGSYLTIRLTAYISVAVPILFVLSFPLLPESPYYFLKKDKQSDARKCLQMLRGTEDVHAELSQLHLDVRRQLSEPGSIKDIFTERCNLKAMIIVLGLRTIQQFSGIYAITIYIQVIFGQVKSQVTPEMSAIIFNFVQIFFTCFGSVLVDKFGRKTMLLLSILVAALLLIIEGFYFYLQQLNYDLSYFSWLPLAGIVVYVSVFALGLGTIPNLMTGELFSANVKAKALALMTLYFAVLLAAVYKSFELLEDNFGMHMPFFFYAACCVIGLVFSYYCVPETKGKTLEEIQQILKGNKGIQDAPKKRNTSRA